MFDSICTFRGIDVFEMETLRAVRHVVSDYGMSHERDYPLPVRVGFCKKTSGMACVMLRNKMRQKWEPIVNEKGRGEMTVTACVTLKKDGKFLNDIPCTIEALRIDGREWRFRFKKELGAHDVIHRIARAVIGHRERRPPGEVGQDSGSGLITCSGRHGSRRHSRSARRSSP